MMVNAFKYPIIWWMTNFAPMDHCLTEFQRCHPSLPVSAFPEPLCSLLVIDPCESKQTMQAADHLSHNPI